MSAPANPVREARVPGRARNPHLADSVSVSGYRLEQPRELCRFHAGKILAAFNQHRVLVCGQLAL
jgi:hypothetical protein